MVCGRTVTTVACTLSRSVHEVVWPVLALTVTVEPTVGVAEMPVKRLAPRRVRGRETLAYLAIPARSRARISISAFSPSSKSESTAERPGATDGAGGGAGVNCRADVFVPMNSTATLDAATVERLNGIITNSDR